jgi:4-hydroxy-4-methyl-2-oxoglutarate aldolase
MGSRNELDEQNMEKMVKRFKNISTTAISDTMDRLGIRSAMASSIKPLRPGIKIAGPALTVKRIRNPENLGKEDFKDYKMALHETIDSAKEGDIIVISADKDTEVATWGGNMTLRAMGNKLAGAVIDCGIRDSKELMEMGFPIFMRSIIPAAGTTRLTTVGVNVPIICGDILVHPGDMIVGDDDGVAVIPKNLAEEVLTMAEELEETERKSAQYIREGHTLIEAIKKYKTR